MAKDIKNVIPKQQTDKLIARVKEQKKRITSLEKENHVLKKLNELNKEKISKLREEQEKLITLYNMGLAKVEEMKTQYEKEIKLSKEMRNDYEAKMKQFIEYFDSGE